MAMIATAATTAATIPRRTGCSGLLYLHHKWASKLYGKGWKEGLDRTMHEQEFLLNYRDIALPSAALIFLLFVLCFSQMMDDG